MSVVEIERHEGVMVIRMNRPERLNALGAEMRDGLAQAWCEFRDSRELEVAIFTGTGRAFCAGDDMKEAVERGTLRAAAAQTRSENPFNDATLDKPVIVAINGFAMGGGFMLVERADLRVAVRGATLESSEAKRWLLGGYNHGISNGLSHAVATELAFAYRFTSDRLHELGFINRLVDADELLPTAHEMAAHLLTLPPASRINTMALMRALRARVPAEFEELAERLKNFGAKDDLMESRRAFADKRPPRYKGWDNPEDRYRTPGLRSAKK